MIPRTARLFRLVALVFLPALVGAAPGATQTFRDDVAVTVVEVPVQVVRGGKPVRGLTVADFELFDRGERQDLIGFEVVDALAVREEVEPIAAAATTLPSVPVAAWPTPGRHLLLFFDFQFATRVRIERAVRGAREMLEEGLRPGDRAAVVVYTGGTGANILVGFSRDRDEIELGLAYVEAIARARLADLVAARERLVEYWTMPGEPGRAGRGEERLRAFAERLGTSAALALAGIEVAGDVMSLGDYDRISGAGEARGGTDGGALAELVGPRLMDESSPAFEDLLSQVLRFSEDVADLVTLLRDVPQPKHLVYFSEGFPTWILTNPALQGRAIERIRRGIQVIQDTGWVVQSIDVEGIPDTLAASGRSATSFEDPGATTFITGGARGQIVPPSGRSGFDAEALAYLSAETGGFVAENFNDLALAGKRILQATEVTYLLVFQPRDLEADGELHRLEVKLASPMRRTRVVHRAAYRAPRAPAERGDAERRMDRARLVTGDAPVGELEARSVVLAGSRARFVIEVSSAALSEAGTAGPLELDVQAYLFGADDELEDVVSRRLSVDLDLLEGRLERGGLRLTAAFSPLPGSYRLRLIVREVKTGRVYARTHPLAIEGDDARWALPPLFVDPAREALLLEVRAAQRSRLGIPTSRYAPAAGKTVTAGGRRLVFFEFRSRLGASSTAAATARFFDAAGAPVEGGTLVWKEHLPPGGDGSTRLLGELDAGRLAPGDYRLELSVRDADDELVASEVFRVIP